MNEDDILIAEKLLSEGLEGELGAEPQLAAYFQQQLSTFKDLRGDFEGSHLSKLASWNILQEHPLLEISGRDTVVLNLGFSAHYLLKDSTKAAGLAVEALKISEIKSESSETGRAYHLQSLQLAQNKDYARAIEKAEESVQIIDSYTTPSSSTSVNARASLAEFYGKNRTLYTKLDARLELV